MGIYSQFIFPRLLDWSMAGEPLTHLRQELLASVEGRVLEIGFGTGLNLPHYPAGVTSLTVVEPNVGMNAIATRRCQASPMLVEVKVLSGEALPLDDNSFDNVVCTWTLCSIAKVEQALQEIYRVLRPGGHFFFIEHGLSPDTPISLWQTRLTPLQKRIAEGCHLNRPIGTLVEGVFGPTAIKTFYVKGLPKVAGYFYQGIATKEPSAH